MEYSNRNKRTRATTGVYTISRLLIYYCLGFLGLYNYSPNKKMVSQSMSWFGRARFFLDYTVQLRQSQRTHTHTPMNTRTQTLSLWVSSKTEPSNPRDWWSHHRCLAVDGNVAYHLCTTPLNPRIFVPIGSRTQDLKCYRCSYNQ